MEIANNSPDVPINENTLVSAATPVRMTLLTAESDFPEWTLSSTPNFKAIAKIALEKFNIDYRLETFISSEGASVVSTRFAAGVDLPDVINYSYAIERVAQLYDNGLLLRLNDLINDNAPHVQGLLDMRPYVKIAHSNANGDILRIPANYVENPQHLIQVLHVRNDWLERIGFTYEDIQTPDDLYLMLKSFQEQDVNGNGKKDEVLSAAGLYAVYDLLNVLGTAFGIPNANMSANAWYYDEKGVIYNCNATDSMKELVSYLNRLFAEGLVDNSIATQGGDQYSQKMMTNQIAAFPGRWWDSVVYNMMLRDRGFDGCEFLPLARAISNNGTPMNYVSAMTGYGGYMFTSSCADPVAFMKFCDWGYSPEGTVMNYYGVEDINVGSEYFQKSIALPGLTMSEIQMDATPFHNEATKSEPMLRYKMGWNQDFSTKASIGAADGVAQEFYTSFTVEKSGKAAVVDFNLNGLNEAVDTYGIPACLFASATEDEAELWNAFTDLWLYMDNTLIRFITGQETLENWDNFIDECNKMGLSSATAIRQARYDRCLTIFG